MERYKVFLLGLLHPLGEDELRTVGTTLGLTRNLSAKYLIGQDVFYDVLNRLKHGRKLPPSKIDQLLTGIPMETLLLMMALTTSEIAKKRFSNYLTHDRAVKPEITGEEIRRLGFAPGPVYRQILQRLRYARLDGEVKTRDEEFQLIRKEFFRNNHPKGRTR